MACNLIHIHKNNYTFCPDPAFVSHEDVKKSLGGTQGYPGNGKTFVLDLAMGKEPAPMKTIVQTVLIHPLAT